MAEERGQRPELQKNMQEPVTEKITKVDLTEHDTDSMTQAGAVQRPPVASVPIRTMKHDMTGESPKIKAEAVSATRQKTQIEQGKESTGEALLPLPNKTGENQQFSNDTRRKARRSKKGALAFLAVLTLLAGTGGASWYFWPQITEFRSDVVEPTQQIYSASEVIPQEATILRYVISTATSREAIRQMWQQDTLGSETPITDLASGNPTLLLDIPAVEEFFYVLLPGNTRPFLVVPRTEGTEELFVSQQSGVQYSTLGNWIVVHPINAQEYAQEVAVASWAQAGGLPALSEGMQMQLIVDAATIGRSYTAEQSDEQALLLPAVDPIVLQAKYNASGDSVSFTSALDIAFSVNQSAFADLYSDVPSDVTLVWGGQSLSSDLDRLASQQIGSIDSAILSEPQVSQLVSLFDTPFVFYYRLGLDGVEDLGAVVELPGDGGITIGDSALEDALRSLILPITGRAASAFPELAFVDGEYASTPLRYVNIDGQTKALDYALTDTHLLVASSREGMQTLIDEAQSEQGGLMDASSSWSAILTQATPAFLGQNYLLGANLGGEIGSLLPGDAVETGYPMLVTQIGSGSEKVIQGIVSLLD